MSQPSGQSTKVTLIISVLGIIVAITTVATGVLAYQTATITKEKEQAQSSAASSGNSVSELQKANDSLRAKISQLQGPAPLPGASGSTVRHSGQLVLADGGSADLDSPQSDPQWAGDSNTNDIVYGNLAIGRYTSIPTLALGTQKADYDSCRTTTGYAISEIPANSTQPGMYACIKTTGHRYSALHIIQVSKQKITLDVVTYDPPFDS